MTFENYQSLARRTQNATLTDDQRTFHALTGMASEVGEIHNLFQHAVQEERPVDRTKVRDEISDVLWFVSELCDCFDFSLDEIAEENIDKLRARYPQGFEVERSVHRHEL